jgi:hypothetical protein
MVIGRLGSHLTTMLDIVRRTEEVSAFELAAIERRIDKGELTGLEVDVARFDVKWSTKRAIRNAMEAISAFGPERFIKDEDELDAFIAKAHQLKGAPPESGHIVSAILVGGKAQTRLMPGGAAGLPVEYFAAQAFDASFECDPIERGMEVIVQITNGGPFELPAGVVIIGKSADLSTPEGTMAPPPPPKSKVVASWAKRIHGKTLEHGQSETINLGNFGTPVRLRSMLAMPPGFEVRNWKRGWKALKCDLSEIEVNGPGETLTFEVVNKSRDLKAFEAILLYEMPHIPIPAFDGRADIPEEMKGELPFESPVIAPGGEQKIFLRIEGHIGPHGFRFNEGDFDIFNVFVGNSLVGATYGGDESLPSELFIGGKRPRLEMGNCWPGILVSFAAKNVGTKARKLTGALLFDAFRE